MKCNFAPYNYKTFFMKKFSRFLTSQGRTLGMIFIISIMSLVSCSKDPGTPVPQPQHDPVDTTTKPSGTITSFTSKDTLVPYNTGTTLDWSTNGTSWNTYATMNGVSVAKTGTSVTTGLLKANTTFTLSLNTSPVQSKIVTVNVADSIISLFWVGGKSISQETDEAEDGNTNNWSASNTPFLSIYTFYLNKTVRIQITGVDDALATCTTDLVAGTLKISQFSFAYTFVPIDTSHVYLYRDTKNNDGTIVHRRYKCKIS